METADIEIRFATFEELRSRRTSSWHREWLSPHEFERYAAFRNRHRQEAWLFGRMMVKKLILDRLAQKQRFRNFRNSKLDNVTWSSWGRSKAQPPANPEPRSQFPRTAATLYQHLKEPGFDSSEDRTRIVGRSLDRFQGLHPQEISICSRDGLGRAVRPCAIIAGRLQPWPLSITHSDRSLVVALSRVFPLGLGIDLIEENFGNPQSLSIWLTPAERRWLCDRGPREDIATVWALKEAIYKAANRGEPFRPHRIEIFPTPASGYRCRIGGREPRAYRLNVETINGQRFVLARINRNGSNKAREPACVL